MPIGCNWHLPRTTCRLSVISRSLDSWAAMCRPLMSRTVTFTSRGATFSFEARLPRSAPSRRSPRAARSGRVAYDAFVGGYRLGDYPIGDGVGAATAPRRLRFRPIGR